MFLKNSHYYFFVISSIGLWWLFAFKNPIANECSFTATPKEKTLNLVDSDFLVINRDEIKHCLDGDFKKMSELISQWDVAAEYLEQKGYSKVKRLSREDFILSQLLSFNIDIEPQSILVDKLGYPFDISTTFNRIFPQTYHAAEILLALTDSNKIVAFMERFKKQKFLAHHNKIKEISNELNAWNVEKIYELHPEIAIVAEYSQPAFLQILKKQGVQLYFQKEIETFVDLENSINELGYLSAEPLKATLLNIFIKAAMNAIDNKREINLKNLDVDRVLLLQYYSKHSLVRKNSLIEEIVKRMGFHKHISKNESDNTNTPFSEEEIIRFNPECLFIITEINDQKLEYFYKKNYPSHIDAGKNKKLYLLDEELFQSTSQYIVLAYLDLNFYLLNSNAFY